MQIKEEHGHMISVGTLIGCGQQVGLYPYYQACMKSFFLWLQSADKWLAISIHKHRVPLCTSSLKPILYMNELARSELPRSEQNIQRSNVLQELFKHTQSELIRGEAIVFFRKIFYFNSLRGRSFCIQYKGNKDFNITHILYSFMSFYPG